MVALGHVQARLVQFRIPSQRQLKPRDCALAVPGLLEIQPGEERGLGVLPFHIVGRGRQAPQEEETDRHRTQSSGTKRRVRHGPDYIGVRARVPHPRSRRGQLR